MTLTEKPHYPIKGKGRKRMMLDLRNWQNSCRVKVIAKFYKHHHIFIANRHFLSPEAYNYNFDELYNFGKEKGIL